GTVEPGSFSALRPAGELQDRRAFAWPRAGRPPAHHPPAPSTTAQRPATSRRVGTGGTHPAGRAAFQAGDRRPVHDLALRRRSGTLAGRTTRHLVAACGHVPALAVATGGWAAGFRRNARPRTEPGRPGWDPGGDGAAAGIRH